jgi:hypothetical protein
MDGQPLKPLTHGNILIVGAKASNFSEEIKTHPRVMIWDSQNEHWTNKDLPSNIQAIFFTRWVGHAPFSRILGEARKRHITLFNPDGTGMIAKQVKELLAIKEETEMATVHVELPQTVKYDRKLEVKNPYPSSKLHVFLPYIDWDKNNTENANTLIKKAEELGVTTTLPSLANFIGVQRKKVTGKGLKDTHPIVKKVKPVTVKSDTGIDVSVQMFDEAIKNLQDMRTFFLDTVEENRRLKIRLDKFKKMVEDE